MSQTLEAAHISNMGLKALNPTTSDDMAAELHDHMVGKTVFITGVSPTGLGAEATRIVALHAPKRLILASRSKTKMQKVIDSLPSTVDAESRAKIDMVEVDFANLSSIRAAVASLGDDLELDVLINNAGIMMLQTLEPVAINGRVIEKQFATNHLGHFLLTNLLVPALRRSKAPGGARVVTVSSSGYIGSTMADVIEEPKLIEDTPENRASYDPFVSYARSKTSNRLFTVGLARKVEASSSKGAAITAISLDPGVVGTTALPRHVPVDVQEKLGWLAPDGSLMPNAPFISAEQSVATYVKAAFDPELIAHPGATINSCAIDDSILEYAKDPAQADKLWAISEELVGEKFDF
ncbi:short-chain dehydrogenase [Ophiostoma piceae UAMH 11346]|uniref:Short-chain dehydrogenase n=1 Tax=Ophiostoma piceae (strain UAMH 11346) TaxID=1262450 RepID=S3CIX9_OPHP1|nr:short-chain dehydrogenase [Ophiostoma piceae UAMH 11346]